MTAVAEVACGSNRAPPADRLGRQRIKQDLPQSASFDLGPTVSAAIVVDLVDVDGAMLVEDAHRLAALVDDGAELLVQTGVAQGDLSVFLVDVEHSTLDASVRGCVEFVDGRCDAVHMQYAGQDQPGQSGTDDGDGWRVHHVLLRVRTRF